MAVLTENTTNVTDYHLCYQDHQWQIRRLPWVGHPGTGHLGRLVGRLVIPVSRVLYILTIFHQCIILFQARSDRTHR